MFGNKQISANLPESLQKGCIQRGVLLKDVEEDDKGDNSLVLCLGWIQRDRHTPYPVHPCTGRHY